MVNFAQERQTFLQKRGIAFLLALVNIFLIVLLVFLQAGIKEKERLIKEQKTSKVKNELTASNLQPGEIKVNNNLSKAGYQIRIDTSSPIKEEVYNLFKEALKEIGYSLLLHQASSSDDNVLKIPEDSEAGLHWAGCFQFGWRIDDKQRTIDVFLYRDPAKASKPDLPCDAGQLSGVVRNAISAAKGDSSWFATGAQEIMRRYGLEVLRAEHTPIIVEINK